MLWILLLKDLTRARRNPWPYLLHLALPLVITALIGLAFGPAARGKGSMGLIKLAVVDEDNSALSSLLRGAMNQGEAGKRLEVRFLARADALKQLNDNQLSAVVIIPPDVARKYLLGGEPVRLELIKNPAQSIYPSIVEELMGVLVTGLNAVARNLRPDFPAWQAAFLKGAEWDFRKLGVLILQTGTRFEAFKGYLFPPLVTYEKEVQKEEPKREPMGNIFSYLLPGLAAMFLLFLADTAIRDLYRENTNGTLDRFRTMHSQLLAFVVSKVVFAMAILALASLILFGGGAVIFGIHWREPLHLALLIGGYALFASGLMAFVAALANHERRADVLNASIAMGLSFVGGSFFSTEQLPVFLRDRVSPLLPNRWFIEAVRSLHSTEPAWGWAVIKLTITGTLLVIAATVCFRSRLEKGVRE